MSNRMLPWIAFILLFLAKLLFRSYVSLELGFMPKDALSRTANAFYVLFSRDPHLAAIGFVWNPLPGLLSLPLLLLNPIFPELTSAGLAGTLLTSLFAALAAASVLYAFFVKPGERTKGSGIPVLLCVALFALNPFVFWYGANGMSETFFSFFLLYTVLQWTDWLRTGDQKPYIMASMALAFAFLCRYEALPVIAAVLAASLIVIRQQRSTPKKSESSAIILLLPGVSAVAIWMWMNYLIMGDAFYFLTSEYSNSGQADSLSGLNSVFSLSGNVGGSLIYVLQRTSLFLIPFATIVLYRLSTSALLRVDFLCFTLLTFAIPVFHWVMIMQGMSFGWMRFFYYPIVVAIAWLPYEFSRVRNNKSGGWLRGGSAAGFALSFYLILPAMGNPDLAPKEFAAINYAGSESRQQTFDNLSG